MPNTGLAGDYPSFVDKMGIPGAGFPWRHQDKRFCFPIIKTEPGVSSCPKAKLREASLRNRKKRKMEGRK